MWCRSSHNVSIARGVHAARNTSESKISDFKSFYVGFPGDFARSINGVARGGHVARNATE